MPKGICPTCQELIGISPASDLVEAGQWLHRKWRVDMHRRQVKAMQPLYEICLGSGRLI